MLTEILKKITGEYHSSCIENEGQYLLCHSYVITKEVRDEVAHKIQLKLDAIALDATLSDEGKAEFSAPLIADLLKIAD